MVDTPGTPGTLFWTTRRAGYLPEDRTLPLHTSCLFVRLCGLFSVLSTTMPEPVASDNDLAAREASSSHAANTSARAIVVHPCGSDEADKL